MSLEVISKQKEIKTGYLHLCRVAGDLYDSWAIAESPDMAAEKARYGQEDDWATDCGYPHDTYKITNIRGDRNGWTVQVEEVRNSRGHIICSREF
jgi:hypothetical protein